MKLRWKMALMAFGGIVLLKCMAMSFTMWITGEIITKEQIVDSVVLLIGMPILFYFIGKYLIENTDL